MKLIYIINSRLPTERAYGIQVAKMCQAFARAGAEVVLLYPKRDNPLKTKDIFSYYNIERNFKAKELFSIDLLKYKSLNIFSFWLGAASFYFSVFFYILFKSRDFKYVYTRDFYSAFILKILGKKVFLELHYLPKDFSFFYGFFLGLNSGIITITKKIKQSLNKEKVLVAPDGVDIKKFDIEISREQARKKLGLPLAQKIVLYTGHFYDWKGTDVLAQTSQYLPPDLDIYFVGGKEADVEKFEIRNSKFEIKVVGHRPHSEIPYWLKSADVLVLPNSAKFKVSKLYTSPLKLFEYMASQRPIVASALPSLREVLNKNNAVLVEPDNPQLLAEGIKKALALSEKISKKAFLDVKNYTWEKRAEKIINFIKNEKNS